MRFRSRYNPNKTKPPRKYSRGYMEDTLDELTSLIVRHLTPYCVLCNAVTKLHNGHLFTRAWRPTRWDYLPGQNCHTLCENCNLNREADYKSWYIAEYGQAAFDELERRAHSHQKFTPLELESMVDEYTLKLKELKARAA